MTLLEDFTGLSPATKKLIAAAIIGIGGFFGGIKFSDVRLTAQIGKYQIQINQLKEDVSKRDIEIQGHLTTKKEKMKEAKQTKVEADLAHAQAAEAEARYRKLVAQATVESTKVVNAVPELAQLPPREVTPLDVAKACDEVIAKKDSEIKGLNAAYANVFDAKTAADLAIKGLQSNESDLKKEVSLNEKINSNLSKQLESQKRQQKLYLIGGIVLGGVIGHSIKR